MLVLLLCFRFAVVYQRSSGKLVGFTEIGDINEEMQEFLYSGKEEDSNREYVSKKLAKYVNVLYEEYLAFSNVRLDTMHLLVSLGINYFQFCGRQLRYWRALVLKSETGYVMGPHLTEGSFLSMVWKKRKEEDNTGL